MAKSSDEIERDIELRRQQLHVRVNKLRERVTEDVRTMQHQTQDQLTSTMRKAETQVTDHPWLATAGGFGAGIALGMTNRGGNGHKLASHNGSTPDQGGESILSRGLGALVNAGGGPVFNEMRDTFEETLSELRSTFRESVSDVAHGLTGTSKGRDSDVTAHRQRVRDHTV